jgi:ribonuclease HI
MILKQGATGAGILYDLEGKSIATNAWGLSQPTNNQAEAHALSQGILIAKEANINELKVNGNSLMVIVVIRSMLGFVSPSNSKLSILIDRIKKDIGFFFGISLLHVKRNLNLVADKWANKTLELSQAFDLDGSNQKRYRILLWHFPPPCEKKFEFGCRQMGQ